MATNRLTGHSLTLGGAPHNPKGDRILYKRWDLATSGDGCGKCECGDLSEPLPSQSKRAAWHREHKQKIRENTNLENGLALSAQRSNLKSANPLPTKAVPAEKTYNWAKGPSRRSRPKDSKENAPAPSRKHLTETAN